MLNLRKAASLNPFDPQTRIGPARFISVFAIQNNERRNLELARNELHQALQVDYSTADLLLKLYVVDLKLGHTDEANQTFELFKRVDAKSPVIALVEHPAHQKAGDAVTSKP